MHEVLDRHPCFGAKRGIYGRIHLPVAPKCNIACRYCDKKVSCSNEVYPGLTEKILQPHEVVEYIKKHDTKENNLQVLGIAGPGEPLYNENTFKTLEVLQKHYPDKIKCLSTNGLCLPKEIDRLDSLDVDSITITMNTLNIETATKIYRNIHNLKELLNNQQVGAREVTKRGILLKINTVLIPEINKNEIRELAVFAQEVGATIMNIMPLLPLGEWKHMKAVTKDELEEARALAGCFVRQHIGCEQCRADAVGIPKCGGGCYK